MSEPREERLVTAGVDVGSAAVKVAIVETDGEGVERLLAGSVERIRRRDAVAVAESLFDGALAEAGDRFLRRGRRLRGDDRRRRGSPVPHADT
ncbi:MAG: hypothetical protein U0Q12_02800 [Vicinamibacterales bacterium]